MGGLAQQVGRLAQKGQISSTSGLISSKVGGLAHKWVDYLIVGRLARSERIS